MPLPESSMAAISAGVVMDGTALAAVAMPETFVSI